MPIRTAITTTSPSGTARKFASLWIAIVAVCQIVFSQLALAAATPAVQPAPAGTHGFPMSSTALDLAGAGYVEEEYFISGTARAFINQGAFGNDGKWAIAANPGVEADYTTRILVRRPKNPAKFNGVVMVEWLNVTAGRDGTIDWYMTYPELLREGYAYVGVSAQYVGAAFLKRWETGADARYNTINHPGDSFSYDIFSQAANAVRAPLEAETKPLGNLTKKVRALIAIGNS